MAHDFYISTNLGTCSPVGKPPYQVTVIVEHLSMRPLILQHRLIILWCLYVSQLGNVMYMYITAGIRYIIIKK